MNGFSGDRQTSELLDLNELFNYGLGLLSAGQFAEGYLVFEKLNRQKRTTASLFNLALCNMRVGEYASAALLLEEAGKLLSSAGIEALSVETKNNVYQKLADIEGQNDAYTGPMRCETPAHYRQIAKEKILRLLVDAYAGAKVWDKVLEIGGRLQNKNYKNISDALYMAKNKGGSVI